MNRPVTISADLAAELSRLLAELTGFARGVCNVFPEMNATADPLIERVEAAADKLRQPLAESLADAAMREMQK